MFPSGYKEENVGEFFDLEKTFVPEVSLAPDRTALLVVDMQYHDASPDQGFNLAMEKLHPGSMDYFNDRNETIVVPAIRRLLAEARERGVRVIYLVLGSEDKDLSDMTPRMQTWVRDIERRSGVTNIFWAGNPAFAVRKELEPQPEDLVVRKTTHGAFNGSNIAEVLQDLDVDSLIITGISTNCCVETTARDAADRGYGCVIVGEGTADYDEEAHDAALRAFHFNFGRVASSVDDIVDAWNDAGVI